MKYTIENEKGKKCKIQFTLDAQEWQSAMETSYLENRDQYKIQGFRPGKAPRGMIERHYGSAVFVEGAVSAAFKGPYDQVLDEHPEIFPVEVPSLDIVQLEPEVIFTAEFDTKPELVLGKYKGIEVHDIESTVLDEEIDSILEAEAKKLARKVEVDRAVELGDHVTFDFSGSVDGVKFDGGTAKDFELEIGSGQFIPGFEDQMVGMKKGEQRDVKVTFPEMYQEKTLAGKEAIFDCTVHAIKVEEVPAVDDDFAKDVSIFDTLAEYKADLTKTKLKEKTDRNAALVDNNILEIIAENTDITIPQSMIERQVDVAIHDFEHMLSHNGLSLQRYCDMTGSSVEDLRTHHRKNAETTVKLNLIVEELIKVEKIEATDIDIANELETIAKDNEMTIDQIQKALLDGQLDKDRVIYQVKLKKLQTFLRAVNIILPPLPKVEGEVTKKETKSNKADKVSKSDKADKSKEAKADAKAKDAKAETKSDAKAKETKTETKSDAKAKTDTKAKDTKTEVKSETKAKETKADTKSDVKTKDTKATAKTDTKSKTDAKAKEIKADTKSKDTKAKETKPEAKATKETKPAKEAKPESKPVKETKPKAKK